MLEHSDMVALGEVDEDETWSLYVALEKHFPDLTYFQEGKERKLLVLSRPSAAKASNPTVLVTNSGWHRGAIALRLEVSREGLSEFSVFFVHWPSDLDPEGPKKRREIAQALRAMLPEPGSRYLLLGDFNEEPFGAALVEGLRAGRDRAYARENSGAWLYNAAWRLLGEQRALAAGAEDPVHAVGTYFKSNLSEARWRTVDQLLLSPPLLHTSGWCFDEPSLRVLWPELLLSVRPNARGPSFEFDHLPLWTKLLCVEKGAP